MSNEFEWFQAMGFTAFWCPPGYQGESSCVGWGGTSTTEETAEVGEGKRCLFELINGNLTDD